MSEVHRPACYRHRLRQWLVQQYALDSHSHGYYCKACKESIPKETTAWSSMRVALLNKMDPLLLRRFHDGKTTVFPSVETGSHESETNINRRLTYCFCI